MQEICEDIKDNLEEILAEWDDLVQEQPWHALPSSDVIDHLPEVTVGLIEAGLCNPHDEQAHRQKVLAAAAHGEDRRKQGMPEHLILTEYHLLRQALWRYMTRRFGTSQRTTKAIMRIDAVITLATNASLWGYNRPRIEELGKWEEGIDRMVSTSPLLEGPDAA